MPYYGKNDAHDIPLTHRIKFIQYNNLSFAIEVASACDTFAIMRASLYEVNDSSRVFAYFSFEKKIRCVSNFVCRIKAISARLITGRERKERES